MDVLTAIRTATRAQLFALPSVPAGRKLELESYEPMIGTPWIRETIKGVADRLVAFGGGGVTQLDGLVLYDLFMPMGSGAADGEAIAAAVLNAFRPGHALTAGGFVIRIRRSWAAGFREQPPHWAMNPITIELFVRRRNEPPPAS